MISCDESYDTPFVRFLPSTLSFSDCSVRPAGQRWATLRYHIDLEPGRFRVKEFFMDWFFPGFPKCLLKDFSSSYSEVQTVVEQGRVGFMGLNYRGKLSLSATILGTQVEIEAPSASEGEEGLRKIFRDLKPSTSDTKRLLGVPYAERSFFTHNPPAGWYEDERISRLKWESFRLNLTSPRGDIFNVASLGILHSDPDHLI
ncbi:MAG: hypothetical protein QXV22_05165, partial [Thermoplasmataceae archaeon]